MKTHILTSLLVPVAFVLQAQDIQTITTGAGYRQQSFLKLDTGDETLSPNTAWDIAFSVFSPFVGGVFINEGAGTVMGQPEPLIELYDALTEEFSDVPVPENLADYRLYNPEESWEYGAFNEYRNPDDGFDLGWGFYNFQTNQVNGSRVYVLKLRNGGYKKIVIQSLIGSTYTFKYANLDGSDEQTHTVNKNDHTGKTLAYFNLASGQTLDVEPAGGFDLSFCRYISPVFDPGSQTFLQYAVTGILSGLDVEVAVANGVDPNTVDFEDYKSELKPEIGTIGHDWKTFTGTGWVVPADRVYFVKTADNHVWKIHFIDFEGSTTGTGVFEKTDLGELTSVKSPASVGIKTHVYPNPALHTLHIALDIPSSFPQKVLIRVYDMQGRHVWQQLADLHEGFQVIEVNASTWAPGHYVLSMTTGVTMMPLGVVSK